MKRKQKKLQCFKHFKGTKRYKMQRFCTLRTWVECTINDEKHYDFTFKIAMKTYLCYIKIGLIFVILILYITWYTIIYYSSTFVNVVDCTSTRLNSKPISTWSQWKLCKRLTSFLNVHSTSILCRYILILYVCRYNILLYYNNGNHWLWKICCCVRLQYFKSILTMYTTLYRN